MHSQLNNTCSILRKTYSKLNKTHRKFTLLSKALLKQRIIKCKIKF